MILRRSLIVLLSVCALRGFAENANRPESVVRSSSISGTVLDLNDGIVLGATVVLQCQS